MLAAAEKTAVLTPWNTSDPVAGAIYSALCERHGKKVQEKLDAGFVTICGLGGLGSNIAVSLARIGVGHLRLVDFDNVDWTNLNRQSYFVEHVGVKKTDALKGFLMKINPFLTYETVTARVTPKNLASCVGDATIICEAFDKADQKAMLARALPKTGRLSCKRLRHGGLWENRTHESAGSEPPFLSLRRQCLGP